MRDAGVDHYLVPSSDDHANEYVPDCWQRRRFISGFSGSAGDALIGLEGATVRMSNRFLFEDPEPIVTDALGEATMEGLQEGVWDYQVSAPGHGTTTGTVAVLPDDTVLEEPVLSRSIVSITFTVVPVPFEDRYEIIIEQTFEGSYSINPDGTGQMDLIVSPNPDYFGRLLPDGSPGSSPVEYDGTETLHFATAEGGRLLQLGLEMKPIDNPQPSDPSCEFCSDNWSTFTGTAHHAAPAASCDNCELVRLLAPALPGGLASTHPCFVPAQPEPPGSSNSAMAAPRARRLGVQR